MLGFETLTLAPIDRSLVEPSLLDDDEIAWLDAYHARVRDDADAAGRRRDGALARRRDPPARGGLTPAVHTLQASIATVAASVNL